MRALVAFVRATLIGGILFLLPIVVTRERQEAVA